MISNWRGSFRPRIGVSEIDDVDTYYLGKACKWWYYSNPAEFYYNIAEEMIDNRWTERSTQRNQAGKPIEYPGYIGKIVTHCTPTKKKRKIKIQGGLKDIKLLENPDAKYVGEKLHIFAAVAVITFVMINLAIYF